MEPSLDFLHLRGERCKYKPFFLKGQELYLKHPDLPKPVAAIVREGEPLRGSIVLTGLYFDLQGNGKGCFPPRGRGDF